MTQTEYLLLLEEELKLLHQKDRKEVIAFYRDKINNALDYGEKEEKIIERLPSPEQIAQEVYSSKGTLYTIKRQKIQKRKDSISALFSGLLLFVLVIGALSITAFSGFLIKNKLHMMASFIDAGIVEWVLTETILLVYIVLSLIVLLFFYDLVLIFANPLIDNIRQLTNKTYHFDAINFSFRDFFAKVFKKKKILENSFFILVAVFIGLGIIGFFNKTYIYRAMTNKPLYDVEHLVENADLVNKVVITDYQGIIKFEISEKNELSIRHQYEFDRNLTIEFASGILTLQMDATRTYDLLGLITEPVHIITILIPENQLISTDIKLEKGTVSFNKVTINEANIELNFGDLLINETKAAKVETKVDSANWISEKSEVAFAKINSRRGLVKSLNDRFTSMEIETYNASIGLEESTIDDLTITSETSTIVLKKLNSTTITSKLSTGTMDFSEIECLDKMAIKTEFRGSIKLAKINAGEINLDVASGQVVGSYLNTELVNQENNTASLYFDNLQGKVKLYNNGSNTEIIMSNLTELLLTTKEKTTKIMNTTIENAKLNVTAGICELENVFGKFMHLTMDQTYLTFYNENQTQPFEEITKEYSNGAVEDIRGVSAERWK